MLLSDLFEAVRPAYLYHGTMAGDAAKIIVQNRIMPFTSHSYTRLGVGRDNKADTDSIMGVSLTRNFGFAEAWGRVVFVFDQAKLRQRYKFRQIDYYSRFKRQEQRSPQAREEAEEFLISRHGIENLDRYLVEIRIEKSTYWECQENNEKYTNPKEDSLFYPLTSHPLLKVLK